MKNIPPTNSVPCRVSPILRVHKILKIVRNYNIQTPHVSSHEAEGMQLFSSTHSCPNGIFLKIHTPKMPLLIVATRRKFLYFTVIDIPQNEARTRTRRCDANVTQFTKSRSETVGWLVRDRWHLELPVAQ